MNKKSVILLVVNCIIIATISIFVTKYLMNSFDVFLNNDSTVKFNMEDYSGFSLLIFAQCFIILFASCTLPFLFWVIAPKWKINKQNWWKPIVILEVVGLLFSYFTTPPDLLSTILMFILWQLPVVINLITLNLKIRSMKNSMQIDLLPEK